MLISDITRPLCIETACGLSARHSRASPSVARIDPTSTPRAAQAARAGGTPTQARPTSGRAQGAQKPRPPGAEDRTRGSATRGSAARGGGRPSGGGRGGARGYKPADRTTGAETETRKRGDEAHAGGGRRTVNGHPAPHPFAVAIFSFSLDKGAARVYNSKRR